MSPADAHSPLRRSVVAAFLEPPAHVDDAAMRNWVAWSKVSGNLKHSQRRVGAIVEIITGRHEGRFFRERLFEPAGMLETGYQLPSWPRQRLADGYTLTDIDWGMPRDQPRADDGPGGICGPTAAFCRRPAVG